MPETKVSVIYSSSTDSKIQIELSKHSAKLFLDGHKNITENLKTDIEKALRWAELDDC